jgi:hypothetical protein
MLGGITLSALVIFPTDNVMNDNNKDMPMQEIPTATAPPPPMYSGDRIIPEQYAACKRIPKIPNAGIP